MTEIRLTDLVWDEWNQEHIAKHNVSIKNVEEAVTHIITHRKGKKGRIVLIGRSGTRLISVIAKPKSHHRFYPVTARDSDKKERRMVYEKESKK